MKPYQKDWKRKFKNTMSYKEYILPGTFKRISRFDKLITKNANRGRKKAFRQQLKKEIYEDLFC